MKRKVQAQRKFAQGVNIPTPSTSSTAVEHSTHFRSDDRNITIHNNTQIQIQNYNINNTTSGLLDLLSFQNLHSHRQAVVVLERLENKGVTKKKYAVEKKKTTQNSPDGTVTQLPSTSTSDNNRNTMCLRSRTQMNYRHKLNTKKIRNNKKENFRNKKPISNGDRRASPHSHSSRSISDSSDEEPLTYFTRSRKISSVIERERSINVNKKKNVTSRSGGVNLVKKTTANISQATNLAVEGTVIMQPTIYATNEENEKSQNTFYGINEIEQWINNSVKDISTETPFKIPLPPKKRQLQAIHTYNETLSKRIRSGDENQIPTGAVNDGQNQTCEFAEMQGDESRISNVDQHRASPCPSGRFTTVSDVINATTQELDSRCRTCSHCGNVNKIVQLSNILEGSTRSNALSNVYEFDADKDNTPENHSTYASRRKRPEDSSNQTSNINSTTDKNGNNVIYLDLKKQCPQVFEIKWKEIPHKKRKQISSVRLVARSLVADKLDECSLVENESVLSSFLESMETDLPNRIMNLVEPNRTGNIRQSFPKSSDKAMQVDAPVFYPTEQEFLDPVAYFEKIMPVAAKYGICKVVSPKGFTPNCTLKEDIKFSVTNQYITRLYTRWGPASREMSAIKAHLASQSVIFNRAPLLEGMEVNLPKLYHLVQRNGGLKNVIEKKRWSKVAEEMRFTKSPQTVKKLDQIYVKYLLPYDTLSSRERQGIMNAVEVQWNKKSQKMFERALNPLHRQKRLLGESDSSEDETVDDSNVAGALAESEDCIVAGRNMNLRTFKKVAAKTMQTHFGNTAQPSLDEVEESYWRVVVLAADHVCVNTASIDTGDEGYGFTKNQRDLYGKHAWNLKMLSQNKGNVLRSLGPVLAVTIPTLHLGMVFSTTCWHRDPHGLPWIEYMHSGPGKIWYGIPNEQSENFRGAVEKLCPTSCQNKTIWLPSDIAMIPPNLLLEHNVSISRVVQHPREFIIVFPKAYSCSICTGYTESESVYFASNSWLKSIHQVFQEARESCEPTMFSLEQLLLATARDSRVSLAVLQQVHISLNTIIIEELTNRREIEALGVQSEHRKLTRKRQGGAWNVRDQDQCEICRTTLCLSRVRGLINKNSSVCLQHALRLLEKKRGDRNYDAATLEIFTSLTELENILKDVQKCLFDKIK